MQTDTFPQTSINTSGLDKNKELFIKLSPNPTTDVAHVHWDELDIVVVDIYSNNGKLISRNPVKNNMEQYEIRGLSAGEYFVKLILKHGDPIIKKVTFL